MRTPTSVYKNRHIITEHSRLFYDVCAVPASIYIHPERSRCGLLDVDVWEYVFNVFKIHLCVHMCETDDALT